MSEPNKPKYGGFRFGSAAVTIVLCTFLAFAGATVAATILAFAQKQLVTLENQRYRATTFSRMLQVNSDDLTNMSRNYVITGDPQYRNYYNQIRDIRDGKQAIPSAYGSYYWKFVLNNELTPNPELRGEKASWQDLAIEEVFTPEEIATLDESYSNSEDLVNLEYKAMELVEDVVNEVGASALATHPNARQAAQLLFSQEYYRQKADILHPLNRFNQMWEKRIAASIAQYQRVTRIAGFVLTFSLLFMLFIIVSAYQSIVKPILLLAKAIREGTTFDMHSESVIGAREITKLIEDYNDLLSSLRTAKQNAEAQMVELEISNEALKESNLELELSQFQRNQKSERLESALSELNMFMRITSHDLSAPIKNIAVLSDTLTKTELNLDQETRTRFISNINKSSRRLLKLITDLRALTKMDGQELLLENVEPRVTFEAILDEYRPTFEIKSANFNEQSQTTTIQTYSSLFQQLIENLLRNALLHGAKPSEIEITHSLKRGAHVFTIINTCPEGFVFDKEVIKPFKRGKDAQAEGTGLGLYICRKVVELHRGELRVFAAPENKFGVEFILRSIKNVNTEAERERSSDSGR